MIGFVHCTIDSYHIDTGRSVTWNKAEETERVLWSASTARKEESGVSWTIQPNYLQPRINDGISALSQVWVGIEGLGDSMTWRPFLFWSSSQFFFRLLIFFPYFPRSLLFCVSSDFFFVSVHGKRQR